MGLSVYIYKYYTKMNIANLHCGHYDEYKSVLKERRNCLKKNPVMDYKILGLPIVMSIS